MDIFKTFCRHCVFGCSLCRYRNFIGGVQIGLEPRRSAVSNIGAAGGYLNEDVAFLLKVCVMLLCTDSV